jgi:pimeloyl-ACP methyl ester carboxylesterase
MAFTDVKGVGTFYKEYGDSNNEDVLFIHGLGSSSIGWRDIPDELSNNYHTINVDLVGFGLSDKPDKTDYYTIEGFSNSLWILLKQLRLKKKADAR